MLEVNPGNAAFQRLSSTQSSEKTRSAQSAEAQSAQPAEAHQSSESGEQVSQSSAAPQDSSEAQVHPESSFEPGGSVRFGSGSEPSFTPLVSQSISREEIQQSADESLAQLQNKRIEGRLNQLAEEQLRQIKDIRQP